MITQIVGGALIIGAASKVGFDCAARLDKRVKELRAFASGLLRLKREIGFRHAVLGQALHAASKGLSPQVACVFANAASALQNRTFPTAQQAWHQSLTQGGAALHLQPNDLSVLLGFGQMLGTGESSEEVAHIEMTLEALKACETDALQQREQYSKLYRSLGIMAGLFLTILLL